MQVQLLALETANQAVALQHLEGSASPAALLGTSSPSAALKPKPNFNTLPGPFSILRTILKTHGLRGLWLGQTGTLIRESGGAVAWFGTKEAICAFFLRRRSRTHPSDAPPTTKDLRAWESATAGAFAGVTYNVVLFPADSVKSSLQTAEELRPRGAGTQAPTFWGMAREMYVSKGVKGLYAGMGITTARAIPSSAMIFLIYDGLCKRFG
jgi:mitochondrial ornithine carrier protein